MLRARKGQEFDIATGESVRRGRIVDIADGGPRGIRTGRASSQCLPFPSLTLALSIFKFDRMEWAIEKCTELGVMRLVPVIARRTEAHLAAAAAKRVERWQRIARQASEQSRRRQATGNFATGHTERSRGLCRERTRVLLAESEPNTRLAESPRRPHPSDGAIVLAIRSRGWMDRILNWRCFRKPAGLLRIVGSTILRAETAAIAATAVSLSQLSAVADSGLRTYPHASGRDARLRIHAGHATRSGRRLSVQKKPRDDLLCSSPMAVSKSVLLPRTFEPDERQRAAIEHVDGPLLVVAGAGTGKTTVLTKRIARLVREGHARPDEILAVTYTKNAAQEMLQRVRGELRGADLAGLRVRTFHDYCNDLLQNNGSGNSACSTTRTFGSICASASASCT